MKNRVCKHPFIKQMTAFVLALLLIVQSAGLTVFAEDTQGQSSPEQEQELPEQESQEQGSQGQEQVTYTLQYQSHCQTIGWQQGWKTAGEMAGTTGKNKRMEAIAIKVNQEMPDPENPEEVISEPLEDAI